MYDDEKYKYSAHTHAKLYNCNINKRQYNETIARVMDNYDLNFGIIGKDGDFFLMVTTNISWSIRPGNWLKYLHWQRERERKREREREKEKDREREREIFYMERIGLRIK